LLVALLLGLVAGCASVGLRGARPGAETVQKATAEIPEQQLLDVWITLFDPGEMPKDEDDAMGLSMEIREAEARFMPVHLRNTMEKTGYWGAVRVVPRGTTGAEVLVEGTILTSNGETLALQITASDATGRKWFSATYESELPVADYQATNRQTAEVFQPLYNAIANDLARYRMRWKPEDIRTIRRVATLRFAQDLAPEAFDGYLRVSDDGQYSIVRLPAQDDPMYRRIQAIRERDFLLIDTLNGHFDNFSREMQTPYDQWRKARSEEAAALRSVKNEATTRKLLGVAAIAGAIALEALTDGRGRQSTSTLRNVMVLGGAYAVKTGFDMDSETTIHREAIEELGESFASETKPLVVDVDGQVHELTGSAETQYTKWRALLRRIYASETGLIKGAD
jgi:hypothetical protein